MEREVLQKVQPILLDMLREIHRVCTEHQIPYVLYRGTFLGAVRHQGFIPWDDDMDVAMLREDYDRFCRIAPEALGKDIFSASVEGKTADELLFADYKEFHIAGHALAVSQITCVDSQSMLQRKEEFLRLMQKHGAQHSFDLVVLMLTDVLLEGTQLLYVGEDEIIRQAFHVQPKGGSVFLPRVMSRKKQVIPMLSALWG